MRPTTASLNIWKRQKRIKINSIIESDVGSPDPTSILGRVKQLDHTIVIANPPQADEAICGRRIDCFGVRRGEHLAMTFPTLSAILS